MRVHVSAKWILTDAPFGKILSSYVRTVPGNMRAKFEVRSFNHFKLVWLTGPLHTDTHTHRPQTHIERKQYLHHSLRSLSKDNVHSRTDG